MKKWKSRISLKNRVYRLTSSRCMLFFLSTACLVMCGGYFAFSLYFFFERGEYIIGGLYVIGAAIHYYIGAKCQEDLAYGRDGKGKGQ